MARGFRNSGPFSLGGLLIVALIAIGGFAASQALHLNLGVSVLVVICGVGGGVALFSSAGRRGTSPRKVSNEIKRRR